MVLTNDQLRELTGKLRTDAQRRELEHLGIPFRQRRDGSLVVLASDVHIPGTTGLASAKIEPEPEPELMP